MIDWTEEIDKAINSTRKEHKEKHVLEFSPSMVSGCLRQAVVNKCGLRKFDNKTLRKFQVGTIIHKFLEDNIHINSLEKEKEIEYDLGVYRFHGFLDAWDKDENIVYDFKTTSYLGYAKVTQAYQYQLSVYCHAPEINSKDARIVFIDKRDLSLKEEKVEVISKGKIEDFCELACKAVIHFKETGVLPDKCGCVGCKFDTLPNNITL